MIHALHLTTWHPYIDGVSGAFVLEQCAALQDAGIKVGIVFSRIEGLNSFTSARMMRGLPSFVRLDRPVPTFGFKSWNIPIANAHLPRFSSLMLQNRYAAYQRIYGQPDIIHAHVALESGIAAQKIAANQGLKYIVTEHSSEILNGATSARKEIARRVYQDAHYVIAVSEVLAERIFDICPMAKIRVIGNLVRDSVFKLRKFRLDSNAAEKTVVMSIGGLTQGKRTHNTITAISRLPKSVKKKIEYRIVGDGPDRKLLESLATKLDVETKFYGNLPHYEAMELLMYADMLVHASAFETFGIVLAEASALGIPVVATRCGGPEAIVNDKSGILVPVDDIDALCGGIENIILNNDLWKSNSRSISRHAYQRFHEVNVSAAIAEVYR